MLQEGKKAPAFTLEDDRGQKVKLSQFAGKKVVLYFYPRDNTPGCTKEACAFRDIYDDILAAGAVVIGISSDSAASHGRFREKFGLPFFLLADTEKDILKKYGAWGEKKMYGKVSEGTLRITYIIDEKGVIVKAYPKVKPEEHGKEILEFLKG